jgi:hypothetical protein
MSEQKQSLPFAVSDLLQNYTPHDICIFNKEGSYIKYTFTSKGIARVEEINTESGFVGDIDIVAKDYGGVTGLPPQSSDKILFIVSDLVRQALPDRTDLVSPDTGKDSVVRFSETGVIRGVRRLVANKSR